MSRAGVLLAALLIAGCLGDPSEDELPAGTTVNPAGPHAGGMPGADPSPQDEDDDGIGEVTQALAPSDTNGISPHSGPVMSAVNIYYIWYGSWAGNTATTILTDLANTIGGSAYWNINATYYGPGGVHVPTRVRLAGSTTDFYSQSAALTDTSVLLVVADAIADGRLPRDPSGVYFVLGSPDVTEISGFCSAYCSWHHQGTVSGTKIKFAFIGNASLQCPTSSCMPQSVGPNGNAGADGMATAIVRELESAATDPNLDAWFDGAGSENADKCAGSYGLEYRAPNGARANMRLGGRNFLIQQNWVNARGGYCAQAIHYDTLDGVITAAPAVSSLGPGELDVFARGTDNALWHRFYNGGWTVWEQLDPRPLGSAPAAVKSSTGRIDVFARDTGGALIHKAFDHTWTAWESLGGGIIGAPAVASWGPSRLDVFVRALDDSLLHMSFDGGWSGWESLGGILTSEPAAVSWSAGRIDVFVRNLDNKLSHRWFEGSWSGWQNFDDEAFNGAPAVASWAPGHLDVFARSPDNTLLHRGFPNTIFGGWTGNESLGVTTMSSPAAVSWSSGRIDVFMAGEGSALWHAAYDGTW